ncbi:hypothetical protein [Nocardioides sp. B-3]|uniref:hypothetical protein n=1 Tax=Nocardioides sp. B-3 TaxID=2895565 RepID=UPI002152561C|nr:hypothetical protein [Nocardioides sp. B-3]UUZ59028.1 hypothetical protein LP418_24080 [Nocardioides sp. B-3]
MVAKREDIPVFDRVFASYFGENNDRHEPLTAKRSVERRALDEDRGSLRGCLRGA